MLISTCILNALGFNVSVLVVCVDCFTFHQSCYRDVVLTSTMIKSTGSTQRPSVATQHKLI